MTDHDLSWYITISLREAMIHLHLSASRLNWNLPIYIWKWLECNRKGTISLHRGNFVLLLACKKFHFWSLGALLARQIHSNFTVLWLGRVFKTRPSNSRPYLWCNHHVILCNVCLYNCNYSQIMVFYQNLTPIVTIVKSTLSKTYPLFFSCTSHNIALGLPSEKGAGVI